MLFGEDLLQHVLPLSSPDVAEYHPEQVWTSDSAHNANNVGPPISLRYPHANGSVGAALHRLGSRPRVRAAAVAAAAGHQVCDDREHPRPQDCVVHWSG